MNSDLGFRVLCIVTSETEDIYNYFSP